jgi:hypothetical protein
MALTDATVIEQVMIKYGIVWDDDNPEQDITVYRAAHDLPAEDFQMENIFTDADAVLTYSTLAGGGYEVAAVGSHEIVADKASMWTEWTGDE